MPLKKDETGKRWVEMELIVPGTPEQVWQAMATGPGNTAWFTRTSIDEQIGGAIYFDFGSNGSSTGEVTTWEPPFRFGYVERNWSQGAPPRRNRDHHNHQVGWPVRSSHGPFAVCLDGRLGRSAGRVRKRLARLL